MRKIIHIDMDAFFASVEQKDHKDLRGKPVIVGGDPHGRGVVAACSYEARAFGIHSAMSCAKAHQLCPQAVFIRPRKDRYAEVSREIMMIFHAYTDLVEPLSLDEAFLDITSNTCNQPSATLLAEQIRSEIKTSTGLSASAGVSYNKFLAKVASDQNKPDGLTVITPNQARSFLMQLPIRKFFGVGKVTEQKMLRRGIRHGKDLLRFSREELVAYFGKNGSFFYDIVRGIDNRPVQAHRTRKSIGTETTLHTDILEWQQVLELTVQLAEKVGSTLQRKKTAGKTLTLKLRYNDFTTITRSRSSQVGFFSTSDIYPLLQPLLQTTEAGQRKIRLVGLTVSNLFDPQTLPICRQLMLPFIQELSPPGKITEHSEHF
ncbi:DNA polymerase IV [Desulfogranum japonicum]|uniref:DNA polymerase IV n=1 Tax=Desulfogranum japonicum TaxID=231447 RepID=UPI00041446FB|nr:DNA polymerase IV [Desulfogranum japonicum]